MRLPRCGVVLTDPAFGEAQLIEPADHLKVPVVAILERPLGRVRWHREISELHRFLLGFRRKSTTIATTAQGCAAAWQAGRSWSSGPRASGSLMIMSEPEARGPSGREKTRPRR